MHVHHADGEAKYWLEPAVELAQNYGLNVERPQSHHLYWPDLDVDLAVESIRHPEKFPLMAKSGN